MIDLDVDQRHDAANQEERERDAVVRAVCQGQSRFVLRERSNLAMGGNQQYMVADSVEGRMFVIKDTRVIRKADLAADIRRQLRDGE